MCLGEVVALPGSADCPKILSAVARVEQSFGIGHVVKVLRGVMDDSVQRRGTMNFRFLVCWPTTASKV